MAGVPVVDVLAAAEEVVAAVGEVEPTPVVGGALVGGVVELVTVLLEQPTTVAEAKARPARRSGMSKWLLFTSGPPERR